MIFKPIKEENINMIAPYINKENYGICDFTVGGILMWVKYFDFHYCINNEILYIKGKDVLDETKTAFFYPLNQNNDLNGIDALLDYQGEMGNKALILNSVTEDLLMKLENKYLITKKLINDWSDYVYRAEDLALLKGKKFHSKRNFINQFTYLYPNYSFTLINNDNIDIIRESFIEWVKDKDKLSELERYESIEVLKVLAAYDEYPFLGAALFAGEAVCAFTIGEIIGDTCFVHIEKADINYKGVYQMVNNLFSELLFNKYKIKYLNRGEDVGIPGLRKAKQSYQPIFMKNKYRVIIRKKERN